MPEFRLLPCANCSLQGTPDNLEEESGNECKCYSILEDEEVPGRVGDAITCTDGSAGHRATVNMAEISIVLEKRELF